MTIIITRTFKVGGVLTDCTSATLTQATLAPSPGTAMTKTSTGTYQFTSTAAAASTTYDYTIAYVYNGETYTFPYSVTTPTVGALTSLATVKVYMGITDTTQDTKLTALLTAATEAIENYCDRTFAEESIVEYLDGRDNWRNGYVHLKRMPVSSITRIASRPESAIAVTNTAAAVSIATIRVTTTGVILTSIASGVTTTTTLLFATYPTLTTLAAAIAGTSGWTATVTATYDTWPSSYLRQPQGALGAATGNTRSVAELLIYTDELPAARIDYDEGTIWGFFPEGVQQVEVRYTAGYATIPDAVQQACCMVVKTMNDQSKNDATLQYEKLGDYSWGRRTDQLITLENAIFADALPLLRKYKRIAAL